MRINSIEKPIVPNFRAVKVGSARNIINGVTTDIDVYQLYKKDLAFLEKLAETTDFNKLPLKLSAKMCKRWQHILNYCVTRTFKKEDNTTFVAVNQNKICGIMTCAKPENNILDLEGICSIPKRNGKRVPLLGKTLFYYLFKNAKDDGISGISLKAIKDGPFDLVQKYEGIGFKTCKNADEEYVHMFCNKHKIAEQLNELPFLINFVFKRDNKQTNLLKFLD